MKRCTRHGFLLSGLGAALACGVPSCSTAPPPPAGITQLTAYLQANSVDERIFAQPFFAPSIRTKPLNYPLYLYGLGHLQRLVKTSPQHQVLRAEDMPPQWVFCEQAPARVYCLVLRTPTQADTVPMLLSEDGKQVLRFMSMSSGNWMKSWL